jgi:hypothetical protein
VRHVLPQNITRINYNKKAKFGGKAYKLTLPAIKKFCDFFMVDRYMTKSKDSLVDKLLDFLGAPEDSKLKGYKPVHSDSKKKQKTGKKNRDDEEQNEEDDEEDVDNEYDDVDDDKLKDTNGDEAVELPTNETLRKWVRAYVRCFHETKLTVNHALVVGSEKFGIDLTPKKADLKKLLIEEL